MFQCTSLEFFFNFRFSTRKYQSQQKLAKKITHFTIQFRSKNLTHFTNLNSFEIENNMLPNHSQKAFSVYKIFSKHVSVWCQEKHLHCTISWRPRTTLLNHFKGKCIYISVYLSFCFKDEARFYLVVWGLGRLNNSLKVVHCLSLIKCFTIFHFNWNFSKFNYFLVFRYFHQ